MHTVEWYFDFISPYSYLQSERFDELPADVRIDYRPILLAGVLDHWGHKGPAEIPPKRRFIYRHLTWQARQHHIPFRFPPAHPFNPLNMLRVCIGLGSSHDVVQRMFRFVWRDGHLPDDTAAWTDLLDSLGVDDEAALVQSPQVKDQLRANGARAIAQGVFGVPSFISRGQLFWGVDAFEFFLAFLKQPGLFDDPELRRVTELPIASARRAVTTA